MDRINRIIILSFYPEYPVYPVNLIMFSLKFLIAVLLFSVPVSAQTKTVTAPNGQSYKISGTDGFRGNDELWLYTAGFYAKKPTSNAGVDVYVVENKIVEIRDRAGKVFLEQKPDPGAIVVGASGYVLSGNGAARRWILANLKVGDTVGLDGKAPVSTLAPYAYPGYGMIVAANNETRYFDGKNAPRGENQMFAMTPDFYQKTPPPANGVDVLIANGKVAEIRDRAGAVYIEKKSDPGALKISDPNAVVISANGEARKWILANLKTGEAVGLSGLDASKEVAPMAAIPCFAGAYYRKAVSSFDAWTGIAGFVKLGTPKFDENRLDASDKQPLDNFSVYMGGNAGGKYEVDAGLSWEFTTDENGKRSARRNAFRPFWRTKQWNSAPDRKEFYFYPGETVQMAVLISGVGKLRLVVSDGKSKTFQTEFDAEGFAAGVPRQFKRVNAIDQRRNEGKPAQPTAAEITGAEWMQTILLRGEGAAAKQIPLDAARFTDMRCPNAANILVKTTDAAKGAEKIDIFGAPKN
jgi:hypothetical protein